jgi:3-oxoacyl-[acyl-carrier protein] reductase
LARDFSAIVLAARNAKALAEVVAVVRKTRAEPLPLAIDLSQIEAFKIVVDSTLERFGRIDALLNIAGAVPQIALFEMTDEEWKAGMELKLHGARRLTIRAWDALKQTKGPVVFMSGSAALDPKPAFAAVAATNAAITALAKALAEQGIKDGIQVNNIVPGAIMTGRRRSFLEKWALAHNMSVEDATKKFPEQAGISRYGQPEEIAELLGFMDLSGCQVDDRNITSCGWRRD